MISIFLLIVKVISITSETLSTVAKPDARNMLMLKSVLVAIHTGIGAGPGLAGLLLGVDTIFEMNSNSVKMN